MAKIAFIGLGHMGNPMVLNLLKHGHTVFAFDLLPHNIEMVANQGAIACHSAQESAASADIVITMLQTGEQVKAVLAGENGLFSLVQSNILFIDCSSIDIATSRDLAQLAQQQNLSLIDAPVSGGVKGAEAGTLTFMVGGTESDFLRARPTLEHMGKMIIHAGSCGNGQAAKICNNMILGISMIAVSEAFNLAEKLGLEAETLYAISSNSSGQCWALSLNPPKSGLVSTAPANNNYQAGFAAKMMLKDLLLSQKAAQQAQVTTPLGAEATALYTLFVNLGYGEQDFSGIVQMLSGEIE